MGRPKKIKNIEKETKVLKSEENVSLSETVQNPIVQKSWRRNSDGLIQNIVYVYNEDGTVNWRKMLKPEHLVPNTQKFPEGTDLKSLDVTTLEDSQVLILLSGIKYLLNLRGYNNVNYIPLNVNSEFVSILCNISWIGNFETDGREVSFEALADSHQGNTKSFAKLFLSAIAENRALIRAVRGFLQINVVGQDEIQDVSQVTEEAVSVQSNATSPHGILQNLMEKENIDLEWIKEKLSAENKRGELQIWNSISDIPKMKVIRAIELIKENKKS